MDEDLVEISVSPRILRLLDEIGLNDKERLDKIGVLQDKVKDVVRAFVDGLDKECESIKEQIVSTREQHKTAMLAFGVKDVDAESAFPPIVHRNLRGQLNSSIASYKKFMGTFEERLGKLKNLIEVSNGLFDRLCVPMEERGEFGEIGSTDYSRERIDRLRAQILVLRGKVSEKEMVASQIRSSIRSLLKDIEFDFTPQQKQLLDSDKLDIEELEKLRKEIDTIKQAKLRKLSELAVEITHLWDLLDIPDSERKSFLDEHSILSDSVLESCRVEINRLLAIRNTRLPDLVKVQKEEITDLWNTLHIPEESRRRFGRTETDEDFRWLESEIVRLKTIIVECQPIIEIIEQRESIISDYLAVKPHTQHRRSSRIKPDTQQLIREEKAVRRFKMSLPRLEKKLYDMLIDYRKQKGSDFEWDGSPYIEKLDHVIPDEKPQKKFNTLKKTLKPARLDENIDPKSIRRKKLARTQFAL